MSKKRGEFGGFYCRFAVNVTSAVMGAQINAIMTTCPVSSEAPFATGCILNAFEVPALAAIARFPAGSVIFAVDGHVGRKSPYNCPLGMIVPLQVGPFNPPIVNEAATMS